MAIHRLDPAPDTLHGTYRRDRPPALEVDPGDSVRLRTLDVGWGIEAPTAVGPPRRKFEPREEGPALSGPIAVRGAGPGMLLEVRIEEVVPADWGWSYTGGDGELNGALGVGGSSLRLTRWRLDRAAGLATSEGGQQVPLRPFPGTIGLAPDLPGSQPVWLPGACGGNLDCRELVAGSALFLPVAVPGAFLSVGDGHAAQGDGEIAGMAIECPLDRLDLVLHLHGSVPAAAPFAWTPAGWLTFGFSEDLDVAAVEAAARMLSLLQLGLGLERAEALAFAGVAVHLRVTQVVNGVRGVHALLPAELPAAVELDRRRLTGEVE